MTISEEELKRWTAACSIYHGSQPIDEMATVTLHLIAEVRRLRDELEHGCLYIDGEDIQLDEAKRLIALGRAVEGMRPECCLSNNWSDEDDTESTPREWVVYDYPRQIHYKAADTPLEALMAAKKESNAY
jgi:hypothetical protein